MGVSGVKAVLASKTTFILKAAVTFKAAVTLKAAFIFKAIFIYTALFTGSSCMSFSKMAFYMFCLHILLQGLYILQTTRDTTHAFRLLLDSNDFFAPARPGHGIYVAVICLARFVLPPWKALRPKMNTPVKLIPSVATVAPDGVAAYKVLTEDGLEDNEETVIRLATMAGHSHLTNGMNMRSYLSTAGLKPTALLNAPTIMTMNESSDGTPPLPEHYRQHLRHCQRRQLTYHGISHRPHECFSYPSPAARALSSLGALPS
ncbi:hypothetical protein AYO21_09531 [Fonsecaea monophora]|uniref:Uncharacterized protein n=1 Tax=Fonsecaea monophora TaxID=254056 RepID=A0A177EZB8_9EURO|nr:hypothetical protein AYO21_09531 [Fonsecaea monophora]OAG36289.1 hypothetical protein AYO21_09531 [Fonsecaea monophora]